MGETKRTIESILDLETGKNVDAELFFQNPIEKIFQFRAELERDIQSNHKRYICYYCKQNVKIRGQIGAKTIMHFAHLKDSDGCPIKTNNKYSKEEIERIKYNGAKESILHIDLKNKIAQFLALNQKSNLGIEDVQIEAVYKDKAISSPWKKPDITSIYKAKQFVIELQLSTTFLSVIIQRQEFYKKNQTYILWVFNYFEDDIKKRKFTQSDVFYNNNQNGFEFNDEAQKRSIEKGDLILRCHFAKPYINKNTIDYEWKNEYVSLSALTFDDNSYQIYYYDVEEEKEKLKKQQKFYNSHIYELIHGDSIMPLLEYFSFSYPSSGEITEIKRLYHNKVFHAAHVDLNSIEYNITWAIILIKVNNIGFAKELAKEYTLRRVIIDILSLKLNKIIGYEFKRQIQIAHSLLYKHPEYLDYYNKAIGKYGNIGVDKDAKLAKKINNIKQRKISQVTNNKILDLVFPELRQ